MKTIKSAAIKIIPCLAVILTSTNHAALALDSNSKILADISSRLNQSKSFEPAIKYRLYRKAGELIVSTYRHPLANLTDLKIDALLIAHESLKSAGANFSGITVYFFNNKDNSRFWNARIDKSLLDNLKKAHLTKEQALARVKLEQGRLPETISSRYSGASYKQITSQLTVSPGLLEAERARLLDRILKLKESGKDVSNLEKLFLQLDDTARLNANDSAIKPLYIYTLQMLDTVTNADNE